MWCVRRRVAIPDRRSGALARADGGWHVGDLSGPVRGGSCDAEALKASREEQFDVGLEPSARASSIWRRIMFSWCRVSDSPGECAFLQQVFSAL